MEKQIQQFIFKCKRPRLAMVVFKNIPKGLTLQDVDKQSNRRESKTEPHQYSHWLKTR